MHFFLVDLRPSPIPSLNLILSLTEEDTTYKVGRKTFVLLYTICTKRRQIKRRQIKKMRFAWLRERKSKLYIIKNILEYSDTPRTRNKGILECVLDSEI